MALRIELAKLRDGDEVLQLNHMPNFFDLDDEFWTFQGKVGGEITFHLADDDVFATGEIRAKAIGTCGRCLEPVPVDVVGKMDYLYLPSDQEPEDDVAVEHVSENAPDVAYHRGGVIDPLDEIRESILLGLPHTPITDEDHTKCLTCGRDLTQPVYREEWREEEKGEPDWKRKLRDLSKG